VCVLIPRCRLILLHARRGVNGTKCAGPARLLSPPGLEHNLKMLTTCPGRLFWTISSLPHSSSVFPLQNRGILSPDAGRFSVLCAECRHVLWIASMLNELTCMSCRFHILFRGHFLAAQTWKRSDPSAADSFLQCCRFMFFSF